MFVMFSTRGVVLKGLIHVLTASIWLDLKHGADSITKI